MEGVSKRAEHQVSPTPVYDSDSETGVVSESDLAGSVSTLASIDSTIVGFDIISSSAEAALGDGSLPHPHNPTVSPPAKNIAINRLFIFQFSSLVFVLLVENRPGGSDVTFFEVRSYTLAMLDVCTVLRIPVLSFIV